MSGGQLMYVLKYFTVITLGCWCPVGLTVVRSSTLEYFVSCAALNSLQMLYKIFFNNRGAFFICFFSSAPRHLVGNLPPYTNVSLKMILTNPEGRKESDETIIQTDEDGAIHKTHYIFFNLCTVAIYFLILRKIFIYRLYDSFQN